MANRREVCRSCWPAQILMPRAANWPTAFQFGGRLNGSAGFQPATMEGRQDAGATRSDSTMPNRTGPPNRKAEGASADPGPGAIVRARAQSERGAQFCPRGQVWVFAGNSAISRGIRARPVLPHGAESAVALTGVDLAHVHQIQPRNRLSRANSRRSFLR